MSVPDPQFQEVERLYEGVIERELIFSGQAKLVWVRMFSLVVLQLTIKAYFSETEYNNFQDLKELFNRIDADGSNDLNLKEVHLFFKSITDDISDENIDKIFNNLDSNGDESIDFNEFTVKC